MEMSTSTFFADQQRLQLDLQDVSARTLARIFELQYSGDREYFQSTNLMLGREPRCQVDIEDTQPYKSCEPNLQKSKVWLAKWPVSVSDDGSKALISMPALSLDDLDRRGNINIWRVETWLIFQRMAAHLHTKTKFLDYDKLIDEHNFTFIASVKNTVSRELYRLVDLPNIPVLDTQLRLGCFGKSSFNNIAVLKNRENGQVLAEQVLQMVLINKEERAPATIPAWWTDKYASHMSRSAQSLKVAPLQIPQHGCHDYQITVTWANTDAQLHTSYPSLMSFCLDAAMDGVVKKHFSQFHGDILNYHVKTMQISCMGESHAGDVLDIKTWEDEIDPYLLLIAVSCRGKDVFQCSLRYHEPLKSKC
ncbi:hypothetical protein CAPTEDRAFT_201754 [Capitella teleta]|uniref:Uncharacterized protein n=1 Tax=Capitella teleta TaxID=283909 RepID=R7U8Z0_CAPTE|nr:hypothetical protein CAPTEDRAFT_201754 [Capitella teleta]|eukprot:ELT99595.1 hypothetical protein CAPTEDRAFT_201754 [Capitella teleta]